MDSTMKRIAKALEVIAEELQKRSAIDANQGAGDDPPLDNIRSAKYLNPECAEHGCQWLKAPAFTRPAYPDLPGGANHPQQFGHGFACPFCPWSARNEITDDAAASARIEGHLLRALWDHLTREHEHEFRIDPADERCGCGAKIGHIEACEFRVRNAGRPDFDTRDREGR